MPKKEDNYFDRFIAAIQYSCKAAEMLEEMANDYTDIEKKVSRIHEVEHEADREYHLLVEQLNKSFITPIEREDILAISQSIDNITDKIEDVAYRFTMFNVQKPHAEATAFLHLISKGCQVLKEAMVEFKNFKKSKLLSEKIIEVNHIEEEGDQLYKNIIHTIFSSNLDSVDIIKWKEIFETMEDCMDCCEDVADLMESVVMKNS